MTEETLPLIPDLPVYQEDLDRLKEKRPKVNQLQEMVIELMNKRGLRDADIIKATGIPWGTWHGWISGDVNAQMADKNLFKIFKFFNVHLEYLLYGVGSDEPAYEQFPDSTNNGVSA
jgi:hypothetical protein